MMTARFTARFTDTQRMTTIHLRGRRDQLAHERDLMRRDLAYELQRRCRDGRRTPAAVALEEAIRINLDEWHLLVAEIRELESRERSAA
jgi:hypothetical protein